MNRIRPTVVALIVVLVLAPLVVLGLWSLADGWFFPALVPDHLGAATWRTLLVEQSALPRALGVSVALGLVVTVGALALALPAGRALARGRFVGKGVLTVLILLPAVAPPVALGTGVQLIWLRAGLFGTFPGLALAHLLPTAPFAALVLSGLFAGLDERYEAVARTLGADRWTVWRAVVLPALRPGVLTVALFSFLISWSQYGLSITVSGGRIVTLPMLVFSYVGSSSQAYASAASLLLVVPTLVALVLIHRPAGRAIAPTAAV